MTSERVIAPVPAYERRATRRSTWLFDVDGTLVGSIRSERLRPGARELLVRLAALGVRCVLWSAGGADYARRKAQEHDIAHHFCGWYGKRERDGAARYRVDHFHPTDRPDVFVDDSPIDLPLGALVIALPQFFGGNSADRALLDLVDRLDDLVENSG